MNKDERSAASTGADSERHRSNDLNPASAPALSLPPQRLGSAMEGLAEIPLNIIRRWPDGMSTRLESVWRDLIGFIPSYKLYDLQRTLAEYGFTMKVYEAASEVEALRQRPGAQAASEPTPEMVAAYLKANDDYWRRTDALPNTNPSRWRNGTPAEATAEGLRAVFAMLAPPAGERPAQAEPMTHEREAFDAFVRRTSPDAWEAEIVLAWEAWQTASERPGAQAPSTAAVEALIGRLRDYAEQLRQDPPEDDFAADLDKAAGFLSRLAAPSTGGAETAPAAELAMCSCPCCREGIEAPHEYHLERRRHG